MEITDIKVNPDNYKEYDQPFPTWSSPWQERIDMSFSLNEYLDTRCPNPNSDNGGEYAYLLDSIGIHSNSDNGWWSMEAVMPENIEYFISILTNDEVFARFNKAKLKYKSMQPLISHNCQTIEEFVNLFNPNQTSDQ